MKIKTYFIPPLKHMNLALYGDNLFALAHYILRGNNPYINFFRRNDHRFITIDSGVAEGCRVPVEEFMRCAKQIHAKEIILPDELYDSNKTIELITRFFDNISLEDKKQFQFMAVPQASTLREYEECIYDLQKTRHVTCIGISKFDAPKLFGKQTDLHIVCEGRKKLIDHLHEIDLIKKPIHCLGYDNPIEFKHYVDKDYDFIRSCDSASAILCAWHGISFNIENGMSVAKPAGGNKYFSKTLNNKKISLAINNIRTVKSLCW